MFPPCYLLRSVGNLKRPTLRSAVTVRHPSRITIQVQYHKGPVPTFPFSPVLKLCIKLSQSPQYRLHIYFYLYVCLYVQNTCIVRYLYCNSCFTCTARRRGVRTPG